MADEQPAEASVTTPPPADVNEPAEVNTPAETPKPASDVKPVEEKTENTPKESEPAKSVVPEKYDLKLSKDSLLDETIVKRTEAYARAQGLSQEDAQSVLKAQEEDVSAFMEDRKAAWKEQTLNDKEIGGEHLKENIALAHRVIDRFATPALKDELTKTGYGNHPELVRMLVKIGRLGAEDKFIVAGADAPAPKTLAERIYGKKEV